MVVRLGSIWTRLAPKVKYMRHFKIFFTVGQYSLVNRFMLKSPRFVQFGGNLALMLRLFLCADFARLENQNELKTDVEEKSQNLVPTWHSLDPNLTSLILLVNGSVQGGAGWVSGTPVGGSGTVSAGSW